VTLPKRQHYVPQFLLRAFGDSGRLFVFDKRELRTFQATVKRVAAGTQFYDVDMGDAVGSFEPALSEIEAETAPLIAEILKRDEIGFLSVQQRLVLARFAVVQLFRTPAMREQFADMGRKIRQHLELIDPGSAANLGLEDPTPEDVQREGLMLLEESPKYSPYILNKAWVLFRSPAGEDFLISDNPLAMTNTLNRQALIGTIGLQVPGIEVYLPIAPRFTLGFLCPSIADLMLDAYTRSLQVKSSTGHDESAHEALGYTADGLRFGYAIDLQRANVEHLNSLQVIYAERFVFSRTPDFALVEKIVQDHPETRIGPRSRLG
jgi:hypothetical protein